MDFSLEKLTKDLKKAAYTLSRDEAAFLVDSYYNMQKLRMATGAQSRELLDASKPHEVLAWFNRNNEGLEKQVAKELDVYSNRFVLGRWARSQYGIGPVIAAGLLATIDFQKLDETGKEIWRCETCGDIWRFAGLDPTSKWEKGQKRPHNAFLKTLCWKIGESFLKTINREEDVYGHVLMARKEWETARNEAFAYREQAAEILKRVPTHKQKAVYATGMLPAGHILQRSKRYAVKLFLSHFHHVGYSLKFGVEPPKPYILNQPNHTHFITPPNWPMIEDVSGLDLLP